MYKNQGEILDRLLKLGAIYGLFFILQSYGYAAGAAGVENANIKAPASVFEAVAYGVNHLRHILLPISKVAWPLTPVLCGILILYSVYLPMQFHHAEEDDAAKTANRWFLSMLTALSIISVGAVLLDADSEWFEFLQWLLNMWWVPYVEWLGYLALIALYTWLANRFLGDCFDRFASACTKGKPWPDIVAALCLAWLYLLAYVGSEFDGRLDAENQVFVQYATQ